MAKRIINQKGFKVIQLTVEEAEAVGFGFNYDQNEGYEGYTYPWEMVCDNCNTLMEQDCYYVAVLNRAFCKECFDEWYFHAEYYQEDSRWETHRYNDTVRKLEINCFGIEEINYDE